MSSKSANTKPGCYYIISEATGAFHRRHNSPARHREWQGGENEKSGKSELPSFKSLCRHTSLQRCISRQTRNTFTALRIRHRHLPPTLPPTSPHPLLHLQGCHSFVTVSLQRNINISLPLRPTHARQADRLNLSLESVFLKVLCQPPPPPNFRRACRSTIHRT